MKNYFKEGTFLLFPFAFLLLFAAVHEDDEFWTPVFLIGGIWSLIVGIGGIFAFASSQKRNTEKVFRDSFVSAAKNFDDGKYVYEKRKDPLPIEFRKDVLAKTGGFCFYCGIDLKVNNIWEMDHLYPHRSGGVDLIVNLFPACLNCNERKWSKNPVDFILELWTCDENITKFLRGFLIQHRDKSLSYLTNRPYEKGICDYWYETKQRELFELIITHNNLKNLPPSKKEDVLSQAQELVLDLFVRHTGFSDYRKKYDLKERIEYHKLNKEFDEQYTEKKWERFLRDNPEPQ
jgi:hypothetical protein